MPRSAPITTARGVNSSRVALSGTKGWWAGVPVIVFSRLALRYYRMDRPPPPYNAAFAMRHPRLLLAATALAAFARYAFGAWQKANPVPEDKARWGSFNELDQFNQLALKGILEEAAARAHKSGSVEQKGGDVFKSAMDTAAIDAAGLKPVEAELARVAAID